MTLENLLISRKEWGALPLEMGKPYFPHVPIRIVFHHFGFPARRPNTKIIPLFKGTSSIKTIQRNDIQNEGLIDIKYHYVIGPDGLVYEGRPSQYMGKHIEGEDNGSIGVMVFGNFNVEQLTYKIKEAMVWLLLHLRAKHNTLVIPRDIYGHSCRKLTSCPGQYLQQYILKLRNGRC